MQLHSVPIAVTASIFANTSLFDPTEAEQQLQHAGVTATFDESGNIFTLHQVQNNY